MDSTAGALKIDLKTFEVAGPSEFEAAFAAIAGQQVGAVIVHEDPMLNANVQALTSLGEVHQLPMSGFPELAMADGLLAYGIRFHEMDYRAATFVDKILKGAKPGELPIERATKFILIINLKSAKRLGVPIPPTLLARADEVIE